jgi:hypothetical protein
MMTNLLPSFVGFSGGIMGLGWKDIPPPFFIAYN